MVQIIQRPGLGSILGQTLGTGLQAFQQQRQLGRQQQALEEIGLPGQLAQLDPQFQLEYLKQKQAGMQKLQQQAQERNFLQLLNKLLSPQDTVTSEVSTEDQQRRFPSEEAQVSEQQPGLVKADYDTIPNLENTGISAQQAYQVAQLSVGKEKAQTQKQLANKKDLDEALKIKQSATKHLDNINELLNLEDTGKLDNPAFVKFANKFGFDWMLSPESQEYQAREKEFLQDLRSIFGGRITTQEMTQFLRSVPQLTNSPEGRRRIANMLKYQYKASALRADIMKGILSKNPNIDPIQLSIQVDDKLDNKLNKLADKLKNTISTPKEDTNLLSALTQEQDPKKFSEGHIAYEGNKPIAVVRNNQWQIL